ncbi:LamG-like jellyroll fold domain-containing protein [Saccharicrinis sp. FJH62]|uniref:LamG-like jellyroll fold domain-containing protein n=1 Tax=Saccharicrinis sp. FJH62 TaxID=3344657 RepID=UPI0035D4BF41
MKTKLLLLVAFIAQITLGQIKLDSGLVAYYPFDGNANDSSINNNNNGTVYGASITDDRFGNENSAYYFDGIDDFIEISPIKNLDSVCDFSISVWFRLADWEIQPSDNWKSLVDLPYIFDGHAKSSVDSSDIITDGFNISLGLDESYKSYVLTSTKDLDGNVFISQFSPGTALLDQWCHCVFIREGDTTRSYINGELISEDLNDGVSLNMNHPLYIGTFAGNNKNYNSFNYNFNGKIDDVRVYSRALNYDEIDSLYDKYDQINNTEEGLIAYYPFDGNANDFSGNENHGIVVGDIQSAKDRFNNFNSAYYFDGVDDQIIIPHTALNSFNAQTDSYTIMLWLKSDSTVMNACRVIEKWNSETTSSYPYSLQAGPKGCNSVIYDTYNTYENNVGMIWDNTWHLLVVSVDSSTQKLTTFLDGDTVNSISIENISSTSNNIDWIIGGIYDNYNGSRKYIGYIDEVKIYNRILTDNELDRLYNEQEPVSNITDSLVAYYPLDSTFNDMSGNGFDAENHGVTFGSDLFGKNNAAAYFENAAYLVVPHDNKLNFGTEDFSISLWVKSNSDARQMICQKGGINEYDDPQYWIRLNDQQGTASYTTGNGTRNSIITTCKNNIADNEWHHVVAVRMDSLHQLFVDNHLVAQTIATPQNTDNDQDLKFGLQKLYYGDINPFSGYLDEIKIFSKALSENNISDLYNEHIPPVKLDSGLVAYYPFDGNAYDYSGNNLHADVNGPELTYDRFGNTNNAYSFDGINDYMVVKDTDLLNPNEISICLWYKPDYFVGIGNNSLIDKGHYSDTTPQYHVGVSGDYKDYSRYRFACDINTQNARTGNRSENYIWEPAKWYFISMTFDGETCKLYVNDELIDTKLNIGILNAFNHDLYIGKSGDREDNVPGVIDDIRIYSRAISYQEIQELYSEVICKERSVIDTAIYYVSSKEFEVVSPQTYYRGIDTLICIYGCDSIVTQYEKYIFDPNYCTESVTDSVSVTDTLIIDVIFTNNEEEDLTNRILIYPNPTRDMVTINTGSYYNQISSYQIKITDVSGRVVFESNINEPIYKINIDEFGDPGMYLIHIMNSANHVTDTRKLILE